MSITDPPMLVLMTAPEEVLAEQAVASIVIPVREPVPPPRGPVHQFRRGIRLR